MSKPGAPLPVRSALLSPSRFFARLSSQPRLKIPTTETEGKREVFLEFGTVSIAALIDIVYATSFGVSRDATALLQTLFDVIYSI